LTSPTIGLEVEVSLPAPPFSVHQMDKLELRRAGYLRQFVLLPLLITNGLFAMTDGMELIIMHIWLIIKPPFLRGVSK